MTVVNELEMTAEMMRIQDRFVSILPERIDTLREAIQDIRGGESHATKEIAVRRLIDLSHQFVGTAGSIGFTDIGNKARSLNENLATLLVPGQPRLQTSSLSDAIIIAADLEEMILELVHSRNSATRQ